MKTKVGYFKATLLLLALISLSLEVFAQTDASLEKYMEEYSNPRLLPGKWVMEDVYAFYEGKKIPHTTAKLKVITEMEFKQDAVILVSDKRKYSGKYQVQGNGAEIKFDVPVTPFSGGWSVLHGKLYVQQKIKLSHDEAEKMTSHEQHNGHVCTDPNAIYVTYTFGKVDK